MLLSSAPFLLILLATAAGRSTDAKSTGAQTELEDEDYFGGVIEKLDEFERVPFVGEMVGPYVGAAKRIVTAVNDLTDGSFRALFNSVMPCHLEGPSVRCEGRLDRESVRRLAKKLLSSIPAGALPQPMASVLKLVADVI